MIVIGAGMAGLLAAGMLRKDCVKVLEAKGGLPDNHAAVLRFKSSIVGDTLNIPFRRVKALKAVHPWKNAVADAMAYSKKTNGNYTLRSISTANGELCERWIAPQGFPSKMAKAVQAEILFGIQVGPELIRSIAGPCISTLPMPVLMSMLNWPGAMPEFKSISGCSVTATLPDCDIYCSLYVPDPDVHPYRISVTGNQLIVEVANFTPSGTGEHVAEAFIAEALELLGLRGVKVSNVKAHTQKFMKILPIDEEVRRKFIIWSSEQHQVYSLGRFATWRPGLELDSLVNDVRVIQRLTKGSNYEHRGKS